MSPLQLQAKEVFESRSCTVVNASDIAKIKEYLTCQHTVGIHACAALGSVIASRYGGRFIQSALTENSAGEFEKNRLQFIQDTAEKIRAEAQKGKTVDTREARKAAEKAIKQAEIGYERAMSDKSLASDVKIRLKKDFLGSIAKNRAILSSCLDAEMKGQFKIHPPVLHPHGDQFVDVANKSLKELPAGVRNTFTDQADELYREAYSRIRSGKAFVSTFKNKSLGAMKIGLVRTAGVDLIKKGALFALGGGSLAAQLGVALATYSPATGCSSLTEIYTNSQGGNCEPEIGLSPGVYRFLELSEKEQQWWLKNPKVCSFYANLKNEILNQSIGKVSCENNVAKYQVYNKPYGAYQSIVRFRQDKSIQSVQSDFGADGSAVYQIDEKGNDVSLKAEGLKENAANAAVQSVHAAKLFASGVAKCCQSGGSERESCLKDYNGPEPVKLIGADGSLSRDADKGAK